MRQGRRSRAAQARLRDELASIAVERRSEIVAACVEKVGAQDAEDMAHEGFVRLLATPGLAGEATASFRGGLSGEWSTRARKECERQQRVWARQHGVDTAGLNPSPAIEPDPASVVADALGGVALWARLRPDQRQIARLRDQGRTTPEIAAALGCSRSWVAKLIADSKERAQRYLRELGAAVVAPWAAARLRLRRRMTVALGDRAPRIWALRELVGLPQAAAASLAAAAVVVTLCPGNARATASTQGAAVAAPRQAGALMTAESAGAVAAATPEAAASRNRPAPTAPSGRSVPPLMDASQLASSRLPQNETPSDTHLTAAAPSPDYERSHVIVALGFGRSCQCAVMYRTADGGRTWDARLAPPGAEQVALPPGYPADSRIFLGTAAAGGDSPYILDTFTGVPRPLATPPGHVAVSAGAASGDGRLFVAARGALWAVSADGLRGSVVLTSPGAADQGQVASAWGEPSAAVYATVPPAPLGSVTGAAPPGLYVCPAVGGAACELRDAAVPAGVGALASAPATPRGPGTLVAAWDGALHASRDGGRTFVSAPPPLRGSVSSLSALSGEVWVVVAAAGQHHLMTYDVGAGSWRDWTAANPALSNDGVVVAISGQVILDALARGVLCTADGGSTWLAQCG
jgi:DNA-directed RNA polymerase specialized sigma24 family protein